jgi:hypothetical protein
MFVLEKRMKNCDGCALIMQWQNTQLMMLRSRVQTCVNILLDILFTRLLIGHAAYPLAEVIILFVGII